MFNWFQHASEPPKLAQGNNGQAVSLHNRSSNKDIYLADCLADVLKSRGIPLRKHKTWLELDCGFVLQPHILHVGKSGTGMRADTTIDVNHRALFPQGLFEYQHSVGDDVQRSILNAFEDWANLDLPVLLDALLDHATTCPVMLFEPAKGPTDWPRVRRVVLGPVAHYQELADDKPAAEEHPFCQCCLFTNSIDAFTSLLRGESFHGIRLYAARSGDGPEADCRVDGQDFPPGAEALKKYVASWPARGIEFRKQFITVQTFDAEARRKLTANR